MLSVPHLDREFDYLVSAEQSDDAQPGVRVRVRFHGRLVDAFILERRSDTDHVGKLGWLDRVVSAERVLTPDVRRLVDAVAARYAGTRADVLRLAIPPRHANVEKQATRRARAGHCRAVDTAAWAEYGRGEQFFAALRDGRAARAVWQALPGRAVGRPAGRGRRGHGRAPGAVRWRSCPTSATWTRCVTPASGSSTKAGWWRCRRGSARRSGTGAGCRCCGVQRARGHRNAQRGVRAGRRSRAGDGVGRRRRHPRRAPRAVSARP